MVDAVESRAETVFVPKSVRNASMLRMLLASKFIRQLTRGQVADQMKQSEVQMRQLGRSFGEHSVGMGTSPENES